MPSTITRETLVNTVCRLAAETVQVNPAGVTLETHLYNDLNVDSLETVEFVMKIEEEFDLDIPDEQAQEVRTVSDVVELLAARLGTE